MSAESTYKRGLRLVAAQIKRNKAFSARWRDRHGFEHIAEFKKDQTKLIRAAVSFNVELNKCMVALVKDGRMDLVRKLSTKTHDL